MSLLSTTQVMNNMYLKQCRCLPIFPLRKLHFSIAGDIILSITQNWFLKILYIYIHTINNNKTIISFTGLKFRCWQDWLFLKNPLPCLFHNLEAICILWILAPSSINKAHHCNLCFWHPIITISSGFSCVPLIRTTVVISGPPEYCKLNCSISKSLN